MKQHTSDKGNNISHIASQKLNFWTCYRFDCQMYLYFSFIINVNSPCNEDIKTITYSKVILKASFEILKEKLGQLQGKHCLIFGGLFKLMLPLSNHSSFCNAFNEF